jgi:subtilisin family serine protease
MGTTDRADDTMAAFSSRGPTAIDRAIKPDLVAPGVGIESLSDPDSLFYTTRAPYLLPGSAVTAYLPYLSLSGTSMAAPVVSGTVALMLQANPSLSPNQIKTLLQYTAEPYFAYDAMTQGAGFLNAQLAIEMARFYWRAPVNLYPPSIGWGRSVTRWTGESIAWSANGTAGGDTVVWGTSDGDTVVWGTDGGDTVVWGTSCDDPSCQPMVWNRP